MTPKKTTAVEKKTEALRAAAMRALPKRITCPKCKKDQGAGGVRPADHGSRRAGRTSADRSAVVLFGLSGPLIVTS